MYVYVCMYCMSMQLQSPFHLVGDFPFSAFLLVAHAVSHF